MTITVTILTANDEPNETEVNLAKLFDDSMFETYFLSGNDDDAFTRALRNAPMDSYAIIVRGTSVSNTTQDHVTELINQVISNPKSINVTPRSNNPMKTNDPQWHLCYLCRWEDRCDLYKNGPVETLNGTTTSIVQTFSPNGTQAILFSPLGREMILGTKKLPSGRYLDISSGLDKALKQAIFNHELIARCIVPNLFEYNPISGNDYHKTKSCLDKPTDDETNGLSNGSPTLATQLAEFESQPKLSPWVYVVPIVIIVVIIIICLLTRKR